MAEDELWRPLGFEGENAATYDALHDGIPRWMAESFWAWMRLPFVAPAETYVYGQTIKSPRFRVELLLDVERVCRIPFGSTSGSPSDGMKHVRVTLGKAGTELRVADYLLSRGQATSPATLDKLLRESGSAWRVGKRSSRHGLERRVALGVQANADHVMNVSGSAGIKLAHAWERAFGVNPDATGAYALAVRAVEDAAIPVVVPRQTNASLGHVIGQLARDGDWSLPLTREDEGATTASIVLATCRALWKGHHDRHGGPASSAAVTQAEAETAVSLAVPLVQWFGSGMVARAR